MDTLPKAKYAAAGITRCKVIRSSYLESNRRPVKGYCPAQKLKKCRSRHDTLRVPTGTAAKLSL